MIKYIFLNATHQVYVHMIYYRAIKMPITWLKGFGSGFSTTKLFFLSFLYCILIALNGDQICSTYIVQGRLVTKNDVEFEKACSSSQAALHIQITLHGSQMKHNLLERVVCKDFWTYVTASMVIKCFGGGSLRVCKSLFLLKVPPLNFSIHQLPGANFTVLFQP